MASPAAACTLGSTSGEGGGAGSAVVSTSEPAAPKPAAKASPSEQPTANRPVEFGQAVLASAVETNAAMAPAPQKARPACPYPVVAGKPDIDFELIAQDIAYPGVFVASSSHRPDHLFIGEKRGTIRILAAGQRRPGATFLELAVAQQEQEMGLLGFALHPGFPADPRFYVNYNPPSRDRTLVVEYRVRADDPYVVDKRAQPRVLFDVAQPYGNHNAGMLTFGPDGYLYVGFGDGGLPPPLGGQAAQDPDRLLGKMLRVGVDPKGGLPYEIPGDNPFVGRKGYRPEIWARGLRNPWRFDFDAKTGLLYLGDVGEATWEEVDIITKGHNYGWGLLEGFSCFDNAQCDVLERPNAVNRQGMTTPLVVLPHPRNVSVIGGYVYRGCEVPGWHGTYFYGDWIQADVYALRWDGTKLVDLGVVGRFPHGAPTTFGTNAWGDIYALTGDFADSAFLWRMRPKP